MTATDQNGLNINVGDIVSSGGNTNFIVTDIRPFGPFFRLMLSPGGNRNCSDSRLSCKVSKIAA